MRHGAIWWAIPAALAGAALAAWSFWPAQPPFPAPGIDPQTRAARSAPPEPAASGPDAPVVPYEPAAEAATAPPANVEEAADIDDHEIAEDPTGDLRYYEKYPMSAVPHRVARGWGARGTGRVPGAVGVFVVVDPDIGDAELEALARDIRDFHHDAEVLSVSILDSQDAATYDRHSDGGALAAQHLVATVSRNERLESNTIEIRGRAVDPDER